MAEYFNTEKHPFNFYVSTLESKVSNTVYSMSTFRDINAVRIEFYSERNLSWVVAHTKNAGRAGRWWMMRVGGGSLPPYLASADLCPDTASKPPSLRWRLGKLTDVCCKYVHCIAGTQVQPAPTCDHVWTRGEGGAGRRVDLGIF